MIVSRIGRYLAVQTLTGIVGAFAVIASVILLIDFVETSRDVGTRTQISSLDVVGMTLLKAPLLLQDTLPFVVLFGVLWAFFSLNRRSELIVLRASGYSIWRMIAPPMVLAALIGLFAMMALNPLGAATNAAFERVREVALNGQTGDVEANTGPIWLRERTTQGYIIIGAERLNPDGVTLERPVFNIYRTQDGAPVLERRIDAQSARLSPSFWIIESAVERRIDTAPLEIATLTLPTAIGRQALFERARTPGGVSFWRLPSVISSANEAGLSVRAYQLQWHSLLALPLVLMASALIAIAATLRLVRLGGAAAFALTGGAAGFLLYFSQELLISLGQAGTLSAFSAAWSTPILFSLAALYYIATTEDG